jgi:hypothetical protein
MAMVNPGARRLPSYLGRVLDGDRSIGTCFQLTPGVIVTAFHVVEGLGVLNVGQKVIVAPLEPTAGLPFAAAMQLFDAAHDLAVLQTTGDFGGSIGTLLPTDSIPWDSLLLVTGVGELASGRTYPYLTARGDPGGVVLNDIRVELGRMKSSDVVRGMSGAPVRLASDPTAVVGVVSGRYNSPDGWLRDSVWIARTEDLESLIAGLETGIARPRPDHLPAISLSPAEQMALGLILSDPLAADRGAWVYPLHQELGYRGLTNAQTTLALSRLNSEGLIEYREVPGIDRMTGEETTAPAYRVTRKGLEVTEDYPSVANFQDVYHYVVRMAGDRARHGNVEFLDRLRSLPYVQSQTRFITDEKDGECRIAVWSYKPLYDAFSAISAETGSEVLRIREE